MTGAVTTRTARGGTLVLGGGFAGGYVARLLGSAGATIVSLENFMLYTPMLPEAASGTLEPRHVVVPLRLMCPHAELLLGKAVALDEEARLSESSPRTARSTSATSTSSSRSAPSHGHSRSPGSPTTRSASSPSPTPSTYETTSCASSRRPRPTRMRPSGT